MQQQEWKTKGDVKLKLYSISELYWFLSMFLINYNFFKIVDRPGNIHDAYITAPKDKSILSNL